jgi:hypothetical protein
MGNKMFFSMLRLFRSSILTRATKVRIYKTIIRPVVTYGCETWVLNQSNKERLDIFERRILRKIYGPVRDRHDEWRIRWNHELYANEIAYELMWGIRISGL